MRVFLILFVISLVAVVTLVGVGDIFITGNRRVGMSSNLPQLIFVSFVIAVALALGFRKILIRFKLIPDEKDDK